MQGKSNSFLQVTPFIPRSGLIGSSYVAFPLDTVDPRGCLFVSPPSDLSGFKSVAPGCSFSIPEDMASSAQFIQGFSTGDFIDPLWNSQFSQFLPSGNAGYNGHSGNLFMTENGKRIAVSAGDGGIHNFGTINILTRNNDNTFLVERVNSPEFISFGYTMSRDGLFAATLGQTLRGAVWFDGYGSPPTIYDDILDLNYISADGLSLFGVTQDYKTIERVIGGSDIIIEDAGIGAAVDALSFCKDCIIISSGLTIDVYRKVSGAWVKTGSLADEGGSTGDYPAIVQMTGDGTKAFGRSGDDHLKILWWDLTQTGIISGTVIPNPPDISFGSIMITGVSSGGEIITGFYDSLTRQDKSVYYLASENFLVPHSLVDYFISLGLGPFGEGVGEYEILNSVVVSANGTQFAARSIRKTGFRSMVYVSCPIPS